MSFTWIRKPWKFVSFRKSLKIPQGGTGSTIIEKPAPLFIDDGKSFKLTKKFVLSTLYQRLSQVLSKVLDQNAEAIASSDISDAELGLLIGHVIGEITYTKYGQPCEILEGKSLQNYVEFIKAVVTGYSDSNLTRNETLLRKD